MTVRPGGGEVPPAARVNLLGHHAGAASRFLAYAADTLASSGLFMLGLAAVSFAVTVVTGRSLDLSREHAVVGACYLAWEFAYFAYSWSANGATVGMALLGVRVVARDGTAAGAWRACVRALAFPLSVLLLGLGFAGILLGRERRALHDVIAGTVVVYSWDARAARFRFLARGSGRRAG